MLAKIKAQVKHLPLLIIILATFSLRFLNLGYSNYQGDEIKAFFLPGDEPVSKFLVTQRKGPGQFVVTFLIKLVNSDYSNELVSRFPFALAGALAVFFFYRLVERHFNKKIAFYASFFFATNGFFVALSRIVQYQAFVILFMVLALYYLSLAATEERYKTRGIIWGFVFWAASILFHYDGIFIAPLALYFVYKWARQNVKKYKFSDSAVRVLGLALLISGVMVALFYIPFLINISQSTLSYWSGRISGDVSAKLSSSKYLFTVYQPIYVVHFYTLLALSGLAYFVSRFVKTAIKGFRLSKLIPEFSFDLAPSIFVLLWLLLPLGFLEGVVYIPGTHIYTYLLPLTIILGWGIYFIEKLLDIFKDYFLPTVISFVGIAVLFTFIYAQSYAIYVDNKQEYPWESEKFWTWEFPEPTPIYHLSMFGFPYYRDWEGIGNAVLSSENNGFYSTNERKSIARFYVPFDKSTDDAGHYIHILNPQSFTNQIQQKKAEYWAERYSPIFTFSRSGEDLVRVYYMESGSLDEIIEKGY